MVPEEARFADMRISDAERDRVVALLRVHCTEGRITLDEFSDRVGEVYGARTQQELDATVRDLPAPWAPPSPTPFTGAEQRARPARQRGAVRWLVAVFGDSIRRGRFRLEEESAAVAVFGDCYLDLSEATIDSSEVIISAVSVFGDVTVVVPEGIDVELQGFAMFGKRTLHTSAPAVPGSPVVVVRAVAVFGDVRVRTPRQPNTRRGWGASGRDR